MLSVSQFFGIVVYMYYNDHMPPHFHAEYGEFEAVYVIETLALLRGRLPRRAHNLVVEWALDHRYELRSNWEKARQRVPLDSIAPLE